jgi:hypothetical protein
MRSRKFVGGLAAGLALLVVIAACAQRPDQRWAQYMSWYTLTVQTMTELRRPCVEIGPEAPGCVIQDDEARLLELVRSRVRGNLDSYWKTGEVDYLDLASDGLDVLISEMRKRGSVNGN